MSLHKLKHSVPIISALATAGCQGKPDKILLDYKFSQQEINLIAEAQREWAEATDSPAADIPFSPGFNSDEKPFEASDKTRKSEAIFYKIDTTYPSYAGLKAEMGYDVQGSTLEFTQIVFVSDRIQKLVDEKVYDTYGDAFYKTALHEYGHFLGLDHLKSSTSVMADLIYVGVETCIDQETLKYYCSINECGSNKHATCKGEK